MEGIIPVLICLLDIANEMASQPVRRHFGKPSPLSWNFPKILNFPKNLYKFPDFKDSEILEI